jgi:hypothetical protein
VKRAFGWIVSIGVVACRPPALPPDARDVPPAPPAAEVETLEAVPWRDAVADVATPLRRFGSAAELDALPESESVHHAPIARELLGRHGSHFVVLRDGRLFSLRVADLAVDSIVDVGNAAYEDMHVAGDTIVLVGSEIALFDIAGDGHIRHRETWRLGAYHASRIVGGALVVYTTHAARAATLRTLAIDATSIDRPLGTGDTALHAVTICDLAKASCKSRGFVGAPERAAHLGADALYVWTSPWKNASTARSVVHRVPFDERAASGAVRARGAPEAFLERDGDLVVLLRADANGDALAASASAPGTAIALVRVPIARFTRDVREVPGPSYLGLPALAAGGAFHARFVGDHLLYGTAGAPSVVVHRLSFAEPPVRITLGHPIDRIEPIGDDAVVMGADREDVFVSSIALHAKPARGDVYLRRGTNAGELGFAYRRDVGRSGVFGISTNDGAIAFVANDGLRFHELGSLAARREKGDVARPIFLEGGRVLSMRGYDIVEGRIDSRGLAVVRRATFDPCDPAVKLTAR